MDGFFTIQVVMDFAASHIIHGYDGPCSRLHGHNWKIEAVATAAQLDDIGISIDFKDLKGHLKAVLDQYDHYHLNDIPPFDQVNPTAENLAIEIYNQMEKRLADTAAKIEKIRIWETERAMISYQKS